MLLPFLPKPLLFLKSKKAREQLSGRYQQGLQDQGSIDLQFNPGSQSPALHVFLAGNMTGASGSHSLMEETSHHMNVNVKSSWGRKERTRADLGRLSNCSLTFPRGAWGPHYRTYFLPQRSNISSSAHHKIYREEPKKKIHSTYQTHLIWNRKRLLMNVSTPASFSFLFWSNFICKWIMRSGAGQDLHSCTAEKCVSFALHFSHCSVGKQLWCNFGSSSGCEMSVLTFLLQKAAKAYKPKVGDFIPRLPEAH